MTVRPPKYQLHKATGQARVRINGHDIYLGKYRSPESEERYRQVIADWLKNQDQVTRQNSARPTGTTNRVITELILDYLTFAKTIYVKDGKPIGELYGLWVAFRPLKDLYGDTRVVDFGPLAILQSVPSANLSKLATSAVMSRWPGSMATTRSTRPS